MDAQQIITMARDDTFVQSGQIPDIDGVIDGKNVTGMLSYTNMAYRDLISQITNQVNEDLYADIFTMDMKAGQIEYTIPLGDTVQS